MVNNENIGEFIPLDCGEITGYQYDNMTGTLRVNFLNDVMYEYDDVDPEVVEEMFKNTSNPKLVKTFFNRMKNERYPFRKYS